VSRSCEIPLPRRKRGQATFNHLRLGRDCSFFSSSLFFFVLFLFSSSRLRHRCFPSYVSAIPGRRATAGNPSLSPGASRRDLVLVRPPSLGPSSKGPLKQPPSPRGFSKAFFKARIFGEPRPIFPSFLIRI
jgi:hypothetical protein